MSAISLTSFTNYLRAFNARDYATQHSFYVDDIVLGLPGILALKGRAAIQAQYDQIHFLVDEAVIPIDIVHNSRIYVVVKRTIFGLRQDLPEFFGFKNLKRGDIMIFLTYLHYHFNDEGKIRQIDLTTFSDDGQLGPRLLPRGKSFLEVISQYQKEVAKDFGVWDSAAMKGIAWLE